MKKLSLVISIVALCAFGTYLLLPPSIPLSPTSTTPPTFYDLPPKNFIILGFLPYWNLKLLSKEELVGTTDIAYFSLRLDKYGNIVQYVNRREEEPGYTNYKRLLAGTISIQKPLTLTFAGNGTDEIEALLKSGTARQNAITNIINASSSLHASGINIDFEPSGGIAASEQADFTTFISELYQGVKRQSEPLALSVDIYSISATRARLWDIAGLAPHVDYLVLMAYDYFQASSDQTGPVAPLRGAPALFNEDVTKNLAETLRYIEPRKVLLGIPFYGYVWTTSSIDKYAIPTKTGGIAKLSTVEADIASGSLAELWDRDTLSPYSIATEAGKIKQYYYENATSIGLKLDLVKTAGLGGIAIWALGYEGDGSPLWNTIGNDLR